MNHIKNPYAILEIPNGSNETVIKRAYRQKAKEYHPDVCNDINASEIFKEIVLAYEILKKNNWQFDVKHFNNIDVNQIYADFVKKNPVYASYFDLNTVKAQARWESLRRRP